MEKKNITLIEGQSSSFKLIIPENVESKIRHLCSVVHDVEWSGILFYTHEGTFEENNFVAICKDIFIMDVGSSGYTEFKDSCDVINYRALNDLLDENIQEGLIHSHNNMATFFSSTDAATLLEEGKNCNHFLSLIVNNEGKYTARITRKLVDSIKEEHVVKSVITSYYNTYNNEKITLLNNSKDIDKYVNEYETQSVEYFPLEIEKAEVSYYDELDERISAIKKSKERPKYSSYYSGWTNNYYKNYQSPSNKSSYSPTNRQYSLFDEYSDYYTKITKKDKEDKEEFNPKLIEKLGNQLLYGSLLTPNHSRVEVVNWVKRMDTIYEDRFGKLTESTFASIKEQEEIKANNKVLESYIESILDIILYTKDDDLIKELNEKEYTQFEFSEIDTMEICAAGLIQYLDDLPDSYVKSVMMDILKSYATDGTI